MAYDPGALEAALAAVVGDEPVLVAELRRAFFQSAAVHLAALRSAKIPADWQTAATRMHSLAASFGALRLMDAASAAVQGPTLDLPTLRRIERAIAALDV